jgi:hypothetical protein
MTMRTPHLDAPQVLNRFLAKCAAAALLGGSSHPEDGPGSDFAPSTGLEARRPAMPRKKQLIPDCPEWAGNQKLA